MLPITEEEKLRRRRINQSVVGTNAMEGLTLDDATLAIMAKFEQGEFNIDQFSAAIDLHVQQMLAGRRMQPRVVQRAMGAAQSG